MSTIHTDVSVLDPTLIPAVRTAFDAFVNGLAGAHNAVPEVLVHYWDSQLVREFDRRLRARHSPRQADVVRAIAVAGGRLDRAAVVELCGFAPDRQLNGFTKPVKNVLRAMAADGLLPAGSDDDTRKTNPLRPDYVDGPGKATHFFMDPMVAGTFAYALEAD